jgi:AcrR family transcriptional regulator
VRSASSTTGRRNGVGTTRDVARAALECFTAGGFRLTQIAHVSERMGVSVGSIYRFVESKEALFHIAALEAVDQLPDALPTPVSVAGPQDTVAAIGTLISRERLWPELQGAIGGAAPRNVKAEARAIAGELYDAISARARLILLLDRCARDIPELAELFDRRIRHRLVKDLVTWVMRRGLIPGAKPADCAALARGAMEAIAWLAKTRLRDRTADAINEDQAREAAVRIFANAFD